MSIVKDFCLGDMSKTLLSGQEKTGIYHVEWTPAGINYRKFPLSNQVLDVLADWQIGEAARIPHTENNYNDIASAILAMFDVKKSDCSFYLVGWVNEVGMEPVAYFITIEDDRQKRFSNKWKKFVKKP